jgi:Ca2+:H+ antiporter
MAFIPISIYLEHFHPQAHLWIFFAACLAIMPLAGLLGEATEHIAERAGEGIGGLLNATFGNAAELIIAIVALRAGYIDHRVDHRQYPVGAGRRLSRRRGLP